VSRRRRRYIETLSHETLSPRPHRPTERTALLRRPQVQTPVAPKRKRLESYYVKQPARRQAQTIAVKRQKALPGLHRDPKINKVLKRHRLIEHPALKRRKEFRRCVERIRNEGRSRFHKMRNRIASSGGNYKNHRRKTDEQREVETLARIARECR